MMYKGQALEKIDEEWVNNGDPVFIGRMNDGNHLDYFLGIRAPLHKSQDGASVDMLPIELPELPIAE